MFLTQVMTACVIFSLLTLVVILHNQVHFRRLPSIDPVDSSPAVSILIPARNEAKRIGRCLQSVLGQQGIEFEVWVLNDRSTDGTASILRTWAERDPRLRYRQGERLPVGWLGKPWACHQLASLARHEHLLFLDADVELGSDAVARAVADLQGNQLGLLSVLPVQVLGSALERLLIPMMPWSLLALLPLGWAQRIPGAGLSAAVGQFMLFRRGTYEAVGGHREVRHSVTEDLLLARRVKAAGAGWALRNGHGTVSCRMYRSAREALDGFSRSLLGVFDGRRWLHLLLWGWIVAVTTLPVGVLIASPFVPAMADGVWEMAAIAVLTHFLGWSLVRRQVGLPLAGAALFPFSVLIAGGVALRSVWISDRLAFRWRSGAGPAKLRAQ